MDHPRGGNGFEDPGWYPGFVFGVAATMLGYALIIDQRYIGPWDWQWNAIAALAAAGAAIVALIPIYQRWMRDRKKVATMRSRLMAELLLIQGLLDAGLPINDPVIGQAGDEIEAIFKSSELLESDEIEPLFSFVVSYRPLRAHGGVPGKTTDHFRAVLRAAAVAIAKRAPRPPRI